MLRAEVPFGLSFPIYSPRILIERPASPRLTRASQMKLLGIAVVVIVLFLAENWIVAVFTIASSSANDICDAVRLLILWTARRLKL